MFFDSDYAAINSIILSLFHSIIFHSLIFFSQEKFDELIFLEKTERPVETSIFVECLNTVGYYDPDVVLWL